MQIIKKCNFAATQVLPPIYNARPQMADGRISFDLTNFNSTAKQLRYFD